MIRYKIDENTKTKIILIILNGALYCFAGWLRMMLDFGCW